MPPDPPSISMLRMLVAAPPQFHYTLFCPPSAKILKETLFENYVDLLMDEIRIKEDLVYDKHSGTVHIGL